MKVRAVLAAALLVLLVASSAFAESPQEKEKKLDKTLLDNGYPTEVVQSLAYDAKVDLVNANAKYVSHKVRTSYLKESLGGPATEPLEVSIDETGKAKDPATTPGDIGTMSLSNFSESLMISEVSAPAGSLSYFVNYSWRWNEVPWWNLIDKTSITWGTSNWAVDLNYSTPYLWQYSAEGKKSPIPDPNIYQ